MHTHRHGIEASSWRVRNDEWVLLSQKEPSKSPQSFYAPNHPSTTLVRGDVIAFRCGMMNLGDRPVRQGLASFNEMCDLYMMYWTEKDGELTEGNYCWSMGPPDSTWHSLGLKNFPKEANARFWLQIHLQQQYVMGHYHYQEEGISVKEFTCDIVVSQMSSPRSWGRRLWGRGGLLRDAPKVMWKSETNDRQTSNLPNWASLAVLSFVLFCTLRECYTSEATLVAYFCLPLLFCYYLRWPVCQGAVEPVG